MLLNRHLLNCLFMGTCEEANVLEESELKLFMYIHVTSLKKQNIVHLPNSYTTIKVAAVAKCMLIHSLTQTHVI